MHGRGARMMLANRSGLRAVGAEGLPPAEHRARPLGCDPPSGMLAMPAGD